MRSRKNIHPLQGHLITPGNALLTRFFTLITPPWPSLFLHIMTFCSHTITARFAGVENEHTTMKFIVKSLSLHPDYENIWYQWVTNSPSIIAQIRAIYLPLDYYKQHSNTIRRGAFEPSYSWSTSNISKHTRFDLNYQPFCRFHTKMGHHLLHSDNQGRYRGNQHGIFGRTRPIVQANHQSVKLDPPTCLSNTHKHFPHEAIHSNTHHQLISREPFLTVPHSQHTFSSPQPKSPEYLTRSHPRHLAHASSSHIQFILKVCLLSVGWEWTWCYVLRWRMTHVQPISWRVETKRSYLLNIWLLSRT